MKISKIKISKFHQFEDFELDLTYPKGHEKEGQALDKVCFIGQSGTGKTTLLDMIRRACLVVHLNVEEYDAVHNFEFQTGHWVLFILNPLKAIRQKCNHKPYLH